MIEETIDISWEDFVKETFNENHENPEYIYRGQSNSYNNNVFTEWSLVSTFNRYYSKENYQFNSFLGQQLEESLFRSNYKNYEFVKRTNLASSNLITKLYFLQHYGIPTCLLDFTFNPLVALYFSITSLKGNQGGQYKVNGFPDFYPAECKVSIYRINIKLLSNIIGINEIKNSDNEFFMEYEKFRLDLLNGQSSHIGFDINPINKVDSEIDNYNLKQQACAFILFDNSSSIDHDLKSFLESYCTENNIVFKEPLIKTYNIPYNQLYRPLQSRQPNYEPVFRFLSEKRITGKTLFNDYQSLKYDFNFFHHK